MFDSPDDPPSISADAVKAALSLSGDQRSAAFQKIDDALEAHIKELEASYPPPLSGSDYLAQLAALDLSSIPAITNFVQSTTEGLPPPSPVLLGSHGSVQFFLEPTDYGIEPATSDGNLTPLQKMRGTPSWTILSYNAQVRASKFAFPAVPTELKYGVGLGKLVCFDPAHSTYKTASEAAAAADLAYSGLLVLLNAVDRSLWVTADWFPQSETSGDRYEIPTTSQLFGIVPGSNGKVQVGVTRVSLDGWENRLANGEPIVGPDLFGSFPLLGCQLTAKPALEEEFLAERVKYLASQPAPAPA